MIAELEDKLLQLKELLNELSPKSASQGFSIDHFQMQIYILGFQDAAQIAAKYSREKNEPI